MAVQTTRRIANAAGIVEDVTIELGHPCMSCAVRHDLVPALTRLASGRSGAILVALPLTGDPMPAMYAIGGQLSIGELGAWGGVRPRTRLVITGTSRDPAEIEAAFESALMTDIEIDCELAGWSDREDGWDAWLGPRDGDC